MKVVFCNLPAREQAEKFPPVGVTRLIESLNESGFEDVKFYNIDLLRPTESEIIEYFSREEPVLIGISAVISTLYAAVKKFSHLIKKHFPATSLILGGNMAQSAEIILKKCPIDLCVIGEAEKTIVELCKHLEIYKNFKATEELKGIKGIVYPENETREPLIFTSLNKQITPESIKQPNYHILGDYYLPDPDEVPGFRHDPRSKEVHRRNKKVAIVELSKGCVSNCTFCHRWTKGYRLISVSSIIEYMKELMERFNVGFFSFADENFGSDKNYLKEFLGKISDLDVLWHVAGMRVKSVDSKILTMMKACGCCSIYFGIESGSDRMLSIMQKGATVKDNLEAIRGIEEAGLYTIIQLIIGMPGESNETINETIAFIKRCKQILGKVHVSATYAQTLPGTSLFEYAKMKGLIGKTLDEEENYLLKISDTNAADISHFLNMTEERMPDVLTWGYRIHLESTNRRGSSKMKLLDAICRYMGETAAFFVLKVWLAHKNSKSIRGTLDLLKSGKQNDMKIKTQSLRKTVREMVLSD